MNKNTMKHKPITILLLAAMACCMLFSCESIKDNRDDCGIWLDFIYDYNMDYADAFNPLVPSVDVFVFDAGGKYLYTKTAQRTALEGGKRMFLGSEMPVGAYRILTVGGLSDDFTITDATGGPLVAGQTTIDQVRTSLVRTNANVADEFAPLWVSTPVDI